jgi:hypothetical protein
MRVERLVAPRTWKVGGAPRGVVIWMREVRSSMI